MKKFLYSVCQFRFIMWAPKMVGGLNVRRITYYIATCICDVLYIPFNSDFCLLALSGWNNCIFQSSIPVFWVHYSLYYMLLVPISFTQIQNKTEIRGMEDIVFKKKQRPAFIRASQFVDSIFAWEQCRQYSSTSRIKPPSKGNENDRGMINYDKTKFFVL